MSGLIWFRRDLRIGDNPALSHAMQQGVTEAVFISSPQQWREHSLSPIQADFIQRHLIQLRQDLATLGIRLNHIEARTYKDQVEKLVQFCHDRQFSTLYMNHEYGINEIRRDSGLGTSGINLVAFHAEAILPPGSVLNKSGEMFRVFTPFRKRWLEYVRSNGLNTVRMTGSNRSPICSTEEEPHCYIGDYPRKESDAWPLNGSREAENAFLQQGVNHYSEDRDFPARNATSMLSPYLAIGAVSARSLAHWLISQSPEVLSDHSHSAFSWLNELIWRDFYKHLLFFYPYLSMGECFQSKYNSLNWPNNPELFDAWCKGRTGYPLVDAAMRQLATSGWMHNRLRMVTASFLTKHLLVDWRLGEQFFMSHLIDGDLSANNGGWQWAAGTGCDAQPWFRIFNPITQSKKFDPEGAFIRMYLPELEAVPDRHIHFPHDYLEKLGRSDDYWPPIVDHKQARQRALSFYKDGVDFKES